MEDPADDQFDSSWTESAQSLGEVDACASEEEAATLAAPASPSSSTSDITVSVDFSRAPVVVLPLHGGRAKGRESPKNALSVHTQ